MKTLYKRNSSFRWGLQFINVLYSFHSTLKPKSDKISIITGVKSRIELAYTYRLRSLRRIFRVENYKINYVFRRIEDNNVTALWTFRPETGKWCFSPEGNLLFNFRSWKCENYWLYIVSARSVSMYKCIICLRMWDLKAWKPDSNIAFSSNRKPAKPFTNFGRAYKKPFVILLVDTLSASIQFRGQVVFNRRCSPNANKN